MSFLGCVCAASTLGLEDVFMFRVYWAVFVRRSRLPAAPDIDLAPLCSGQTSCWAKTVRLFVGHANMHSIGHAGARTGLGVLS